MRWLLAAAAMGVAVAGLGLWGVWEVGARLSAPAPRSAGEPPPDLPAVAVEFAGGGGDALRGWYVAGDRPGRSVVLLHGVRASRLSLVGRARFLHRAGYSVLLFDHRAHGESAGDRITYGQLEAQDAAAAIAWTRDRRTRDAVAAIGLSLGGAATVLGAEPGSLDALVVESMHPSLEDAVANRIAMRLGEPSRALAPLLLLQLRARLGVDPAALAPVGRIAELDVPLLVITGSADEHTTLAQARRVYEAAREPKSIWVVEGAQHVDLHRFAPAAYEKRVLAFLEDAMARPGASERER